jgi:hypothetical protein
VTDLQRMIAWAGVWATILGVVGWVRAPRFAFVWVFLIGFGVAPVVRKAFWSVRRHLGRSRGR